jgi:hypothetical protein
MKNFKIHFCKYSGLVTVGWEYGYQQGINIHLGLKPKFWKWGYNYSWYDGPYTYFGVGPLLLICWD